MSSDYICFNTYMSRLLKARVRLENILVEGTHGQFKNVGHMAIRDLKGKGFGNIAFFNPSTLYEISTWDLNIEAGTMELHEIIAFDKTSLRSHLGVLLKVGRMKFS